MSQTQQPTYEFEGLPLEPVDSGTSLLVTGPALGGTREVVMRLLACQAGEGMLLLSTDLQGEEVIEAFEAGGCAYNTSLMAVIDCTENSTENDDRNIHAVSSPRDLTGMGILFSSFYEDLYSAGIEQVRTGLFTLAPLLMYADEVQPLYRFLHTVTGRIRTADGLGVTVMDPGAQEETTFRTLSQPFDARIEVRERDDGQRQLRARGLADQPDGWLDL